MVVLFGLNHKTAPIEIREKFVFCEEDIKRSNYFLSKQLIEGLIIVSTCNRTEFYLDIEDNDPEAALEFFKEELSKHRKLKQFDDKHFYSKTQKESISHLFTVTTGLDSMALGEYQIVSQLKDALALSQKYQLSSPLLIRLFNKAFEASKKARTSTGLNKGAISVSYAAVEIINRDLKKLEDQSILLIGAGETGELTIQSLMKKGCKNFTIANRTFENAKKLAQKYNAKAEELSKIDQLLIENNIIVSSTSSKKAIVTAEMAKKAMKAKNGEPLVFIDLSVPRNIDKDVKDIDNVNVYDMDKLNEVIDQNYEERKSKIKDAEVILEKVVNEFIEWCTSRKLSKAFQNINQNIKLINRAQLIEYKRYNKNEDTKDVSEFGELVTNKIARIMIQNIKSITDNGKKEEYVRMVNELFETNQNLKNE